MNADTAQLKDALRREYIKCASNPIYFLKKYAIIQHPMRGKIPFHLYDFQGDILLDFIKFDYNIILKARQLGLSTLVAGYSLWMMTFQSDKNILVIATKQDVAKNLVTKVRIMHANLPPWLKQTCSEDNKLNLRYANGSQIKAITSAEEAGSSEELTLFILDEAAFMNKIDGIWGASQQTLATGGKAIVLSTPNGVGNFFHKTFTKAEAGENQFNPITLHWTKHPERDEAWRKAQDLALGPTMAAQECDCDFLTSGQTVIDPMILEEYRMTRVKDPIEKRALDRNYWIWKYPKANTQYLVAADVSRGDGQDYSTFHIIDIDNLEQVAEYQGKISTRDFGNLCVLAAVEYNNALLVIENNTIGWAAIQQVIDRGYPNLFYTSQDLHYVDVHHQISNKYRTADKKLTAGFGVSSKTRPLIIAKLEQYFREKEVQIYSKRLLDELFVFIYHNYRAEAMVGYNDDLVIALAIGLWIRDTAMRLRTEGINLQKISIEHITKVDPVYTSKEEKHDSWEQELPTGEKEDLTQWL